MTRTYVHGHAPRELQRLQDQARTLQALLHHDTQYPAGSRVLEAGCGVGAQTLTLARQSPDASFTSVDVSAVCVAKTRRALARAGVTNVEVRQADVFHLPFGHGSFDHVFVCFVLEHLRRPDRALEALQHVIKPGGTITVIEGDHGSTFFHPDDERAREAIACLVELQARGGGNAMIGRQVYPLMVGAGLDEVHVSPRMVYVDASRPELVTGFTKNTFTAMVRGVRTDAIAARLITRQRFDAGIRALRRTARADGVFCYTFFKGVGRTPTTLRRPTAALTA